MATIKQRLHRKNSSNTYDTIHLETSADLITGTLPVSHGGTGATTAANARTNLGAAATSHTHAISQVTNLQTTLNGKANSSHNHSASNITSGTLGVARGGTGRSTLTSGYFLRGNGTGAVTMSSVDQVKSALGIGGSDLSDIITGSIALGAVVNMGDMVWTICHIDEAGKRIILCATYINESIQFGSNTNYYNSTIAARCKTYENILPTNVRNMLVTYDIYGVQSKVWIPRAGMVSATEDNNAAGINTRGEFDLFLNNASRIAYTTSGSDQTWWTSSPEGRGNLYYVDMDGSIIDSYDNRNGGAPSASHGFRPFCCLPLQ